MSQRASSESSPQTQRSETAHYSNSLKIDLSRFGLQFTGLTLTSPCGAAADNIEALGAGRRSQSTPSPTIGMTGKVPPPRWPYLTSASVELFRARQGPFK